MDETTIFTVITIVLSGLLLLLYHFQLDPNKDIERYMFKNAKSEHTLFKLAYYVLFLSLAINVRYLIFSRRR